MELTIIMPALDEQENIADAIDSALSALNELGIEGEILVVNDGSRDATPSLIEKKMRDFPGRIRMINHRSPQGIGASFWDGLESAKGDAVCMLPGDNENEPKEILRYINLLKEVDIVNPFVLNRKARSRSRNFLSSLYRFIVNMTFSTSLNYTNGTVLYRKSPLRELDRRTTGFFFQTDILIRLIRRGYLFAEVPYRLKRRKGGRTKALSLCSLKEVIRGYLRLVMDIYLRRRAQAAYVPDSATARYKKG